MRKRRLLPAKKVLERYGDVSPMTLWRWIRDFELNFPKPIYIRRQRYFDEEELDRFDERQRKQAA